MRTGAIVYTRSITYKGNEESIGGKEIIKKSRNIYTFNRTGTVSYTHLDVYKRQVTVSSHRN